MIDISSRIRLGTIPRPSDVISDGLQSYLARSTRHQGWQDGGYLRRNKLPPTDRPPPTQDAVQQTIMWTDQIILWNNNTDILNIKILRLHGRRRMCSSDDLH